MDNFRSEDYQFKCNGINSGYKFYSTDKNDPFTSINALLIETRINDDLATKLSTRMSFKEISKIIKRTEEVVLNSVPTFNLYDKLKSNYKSLNLILIPDVLQPVESLHSHCLADFLLDRPNDL
jgi:hypothetical protein